MSKQARELKQQKIRKRNTILFAFFLIIALFIGIGYYRSNESQVLTKEDFVNSVSGEVFLLKDIKYLILDNFSSNSLNFKEGTKVSGYDVLTKSPMILNQEFVTGRIQALQKLIANASYNNWDDYARSLVETLDQVNLLNSEGFDYYKQTACYVPATLEELQNKVQIYSAFKAQTPVELTLTNFKIQDTGFIYSSVSEYEQLANESVLGYINGEMVRAINRLDTSGTTALKLVNSDHFFALTTVGKDTLVQGESEALELKKSFSEGMNNSQYYNMLITRVDRLREYPQLSFDYKGQNYPVYLIDVIQESNEKILVFIIKDFLSSLASSDRIEADINTQNLKAYLVPKSAIIERDGKTYIELLKKGYFTNEVEVHVTSYIKGEAVLSVSDNPDLSSGTSIKIYP